MLYELRVQDSSAAGTRYLYEEIIEQFLDPGITDVEGIFAFASANGVIGLLDDPAFRAFVSRGGTVRVLVGLDAVTDHRALQALLDASNSYGPRFVPHVFKSEQPGLFHPKMVRGRRDDESGVLLVGSGNLTPGGLRDNIEAYSVLRFDAATPPDDSEWDAFLANHGDEISLIDADALERGLRNAQRSRLGRRIARRRPTRVPVEAVGEELGGGEEARQLDEIPDGKPDDRMLVATVPAAGGRWHQVHFNEPAIRLYFRARPGTSDRVFLYRLEPGGTVVAEPPRPVVFSAATNRNHKIEFGARHGSAYPTAGPPILVLRELGQRQHLYILLFPGEPGYTEMESLLSVERTIGPGVPRALVTRGRLEAVWPAVPL